MREARQAALAGEAGVGRLADELAGLRAELTDREKGAERLRRRAALVGRGRAVAWVVAMAGIAVAAAGWALVVRLLMGR